MAEVLIARRAPAQQAEDDLDFGLILNDVTGQIVGFYGHNDTDDEIICSYAMGTLTERIVLPAHTTSRQRVSLQPSRRASLRPATIADHPWQQQVGWVPGYDSLTVERIFGTPRKGSPTVLSAAQTEFTSSATTTHNVPMPSTVDPLDGIVVGFYQTGASNLSATGFSEIARGVNTDALTVMARVAIGTEDSTSINFLTTSTSFAFAHTYRIDAGTWREVVSSITATVATGTSATPDPPNHAPWQGSNDYLWLTFCGKTSGTITAAPTNYTDLLTNASGDNMGSARRTNTAASENPGTFGGSTSSTWVAITLSVGSDTLDMGAKPYLVGVGPQFSGTGATAGVLPGGLLTGDLLLWIMETEGEDANAEPIPDSWVALDEVASGTDSATDRTRLTVARIFYSGSDPDLTSTDPGDHHDGFIAAFRNVDSTTPIHAQQTSSDATNDTAMSVTGLTTTLDNCLIVQIEANGDDDGVGGPVGWTSVANANLDAPPVSNGGRAGTTSGSDGSVGMWFGGLASQGPTGDLTGTIGASEESASITIALAPASAAEPEFEVELASEGDAGTDASLLTERLFTIEQGAEGDTASDVSLQAEPLLSIEQAFEGDTAQDVVAAPVQTLVAEQAEEGDTAFDVVLSAEPSLAIEQAVESDTAQDAALLLEPLFGAELGGESDAAAELGLATEPVLVVEAAAETNLAADVSLPIELELIAEQTAETNVASDVTMSPESFFVVEQAAESDVGADPDLQAEPLFTVELASEVDVAEDVVVSSLSGFEIEEAEESDTAAEAVMSVEPSFITELAGESAAATDVLMATDLSITIELASEATSAIDPSLSTELAIITEIAAELNLAVDVSLENILAEIIAELATENDVAFDAVFVIYFIRFDPVNQSSDWSQGTFTSAPQREFENTSTKWSRGEFD